MIFKKPTMKSAAGIALFLMITIIIMIIDIWSLQVIPERSKVNYVNEKYVSDVKLYVRRYSRRGNYYMNLEGTIKHTMDNNISADFIFYEYLHNEYKRSFVEFHFKGVCDMVNKDPYIGKAVADVGLKCPVAPGKLLVSNVTVPAQDFPNVWPFERCKVEIIFKVKSTGELIFNADMFARFVQTFGK